MSHSTSSTPSHSTTTSHHSLRPLTQTQQDRQARNKDPYESSNESDSSAGRWDAYGNDSFANIQSRREAAITLDNPELVMMLAQSRNDSIPATRHRLTKQMLGFITKADLEREEAEDKAKNRDFVAAPSVAVAAGSSGNKKKKRVGEDL